MVIIYYLGKLCTTLKLSAMTEIKLYVAFNSLFQLKFKRIFVINRFSFSFSAKSFCNSSSSDEPWWYVNFAEYAYYKFYVIKRTRGLFFKGKQTRICFWFCKMGQLFMFFSEQQEKAKFVLWMATLKKNKIILFSEVKG